MYQKSGVCTTLSLNIKNKKIRLKVVISNPIAMKLKMGFKKLNFFILSLKLIFGGNRDLNKSIFNHFIFLISQSHRVANFY